MAEVPWYEAVDTILPHVVRISTPRGSGTGFLVARAKKTGMYALATAAHVIGQAHVWEEPIRIEHAESGKSILTRRNDRSIILHEDDTAAIVLGHEELPLPKTSLPLVSAGRTLRVGNDIAWLGFPAIRGADLCFFGGRVSAWIQRESAYLVDGVAINGVSGGPAFYVRGKKVMVMGVVSAYAPNRATGETLPGLSVVRSVRKLHEVVKSLSTFDEARARETPPTAVPAPSGPPPDDAPHTRRNV